MRQAPLRASLCLPDLMRDRWRDVWLAVCVLIPLPGSCDCLLPLDIVLVLSIRRETVGGRVSLVVLFVALLAVFFGSLFMV